MRASVLVLMLSACVALMGCEMAEAALMEQAVEQSAAVTASSVAIDASAAAVATLPGCPVFDGNEWLLGPTLVPIRYPVTANAGDTITGFRVYFRKGTSYVASAYLESADGATGIREAASDPAIASGTSGLSVANVTGLAVPVRAGVGYSIRVYGNGVAAGDVAMNAVVDLQRR